MILAPVGGHYTAEPEVIHELIRRLSPAVMIPMHYRTPKSGFPVLKTCEEYLKDCGNVTRYETDTIRLEAGKREKEDAPEGRKDTAPTASPDVCPARPSSVRTIVLKQWALDA